MSTLVNEIFSLKQSQRSWHIPVLAAISMGLPLVIGIFLGDFNSAVCACMGGIVILYLNPAQTFLERMLTIILCSMGFIISYTIGLLSSFHPAFATLVFGMFSFAIHWLSLFLKMNPPKSFFFIMLCAMAICLPHQGVDVSQRIGLVALGVLGAILVCFLYSVIMFFLTRPETKGFINLQIAVNRYDITISSMIIGICMMISLGVGLLFQLDNPYWIPISCLAVMQGNNTKHIYIRVVSRILGTAIGVVLIWLMLHFSLTPVSITILLILLQFSIEFLITKNYTYTVIFITAFTFLLAEAGNPMLYSPKELFIIRLKDIVIGSVIGGFGGWLLYHEYIRRSFTNAMSSLKTRDM